MRRNNAATQAHWTNILFPWQVFFKDKDGDKIHWSNIFLAGTGLPSPQSFIQKRVGTVEPLEDDTAANNNTAQSSQIIYVLIALAIGLCVAFVFVKLSK